MHKKSHLYRRETKKGRMIDKRDNEMEDKYEREDKCKIDCKFEKEDKCEKNCKCKTYKLCFKEYFDTLLDEDFYKCINSHYSLSNIELIKLSSDVIIYDESENTYKDTNIQIDFPKCHFDLNTICLPVNTVGIRNSQLTFMIKSDKTNVVINFQYYMIYMLLYNYEKLWMETCCDNFKKLFSLSLRFSGILYKCQDYFNLYNYDEELKCIDFVAIKQNLDIELLENDKFKNILDLLIDIQNHNIYYNTHYGNNFKNYIISKYIFLFKDISLCIKSTYYHEKYNLHNTLLYILISDNCDVYIKDTYKIIIDYISEDYKMNNSSINSINIDIEKTDSPSSIVKPKYCKEEDASTTNVIIDSINSNLNFNNTNVIYSNLNVRCNDLLNIEDNDNEVKFVTGGVLENNNQIGYDILGIDQTDRLVKNKNYNLNDKLEYPTANEKTYLCNKLYNIIFKDCKYTEKELYIDIYFKKLDFKINIPFSIYFYGDAKKISCHGLSEDILSELESKLCTFLETDEKFQFLISSIETKQKTYHYDYNDKLLCKIYNLIYDYFDKYFVLSNSILKNYYIQNIADENPVNYIAPSIKCCNEIIIPYWLKCIINDINYLAWVNNTTQLCYLERLESKNIITFSEIINYIYFGITKSDCLNPQIDIERDLEFYNIIPFDFKSNFYYLNKEQTNYIQDIMIKLNYNPKYTCEFEKFYENIYLKYFLLEKDDINFITIYDLVCSINTKENKLYYPSANDWIFKNNMDLNAKYYLLLKLALKLSIPLSYLIRLIAEFKYDFWNYCKSNISLDNIKNIDRHDINPYTLGYIIIMIGLDIHMESDNKLYCDKLLFGIDSTYNSDEEDDDESNKESEDKLPTELKYKLKSFLDSKSFESKALVNKTYYSILKFFEKDKFFWIKQRNLLLFKQLYIELQLQLLNINNVKYIAPFAS